MGRTTRDLWLVSNPECHPVAGGWFLGMSLFQFCGLFPSYLCDLSWVWGRKKKRPKGFGEGEATANRWYPSSYQTLVSMTTSITPKREGIEHIRIFLMNTLCVWWATWLQKHPTLPIYLIVINANGVRAADKGRLPTIYLLCEWHSQPFYMSRISLLACNT